MERSLVAVTVLALSVWVGGIVVLGACAAPLVFRIVSAPTSGFAMGAVFRRFDAVAMTCAVVVLGCEAIRISLERRKSRLGWFRGMGAIVAAGCAFYEGASVSPSIVALHAAGAIRGLGEDGQHLERLHRVAEALGKSEALVGTFLLVACVLSVPPREHVR